jgi:hypothetical protein
MVTASYCTDQMRALHTAAEDAGITIVNEVRHIKLCYLTIVKTCFTIVNKVRNLELCSTVFYFSITFVSF